MGLTLCALLGTGCFLDLAVDPPKPSLDQPRDVCDPLAPDPQPLWSEPLFAAGVAPDGAVYATTKIDSWLNRATVFVSEGDTLVRRGVLGLAQFSGRSFVGQVVFEDAPVSRLSIATQEDGTLRMALVHDGESTPYAELVEKIELSVLPLSAVEQMPKRNFPGLMSLVAVGETGRGDQLVVARRKDEPYAFDVRVFFGKQVLNEYRVRWATPEKVDFEDDSGKVWYSAEFVDPASFLAHRAQSLMLADVSQGIPAGLTFRCLR